MINKDFFAALDELEKTRRINKSEFIASLEAGLASAYKKENAISTAVEVKLYPEQNKIRVFAYKTIVEEVNDEEKEISLEDAKKIKPSYKVGDTISEEITPKNFSRIAAQTARQVIMQRLTDIKKEQVFDEMNEKSGEIVNAIVRKVEPTSVYVEILPTQMEGIMPVSEQIRTEKYNVGDMIKVLVRRITTSNRSPQVIVSRAHPDFVRRLFELDVPEVKSGLVQIKKIVREAGFRTKIAVYAEDPNVDAVGSCIGPRGSRINVIV
ncbi:MAG: transcription termination factor NusA, partial [Clostridia bacterium]|nr:transcription termination factor NusA [Clostridia bacterium]